MPAHTCRDQAVVADMSQLTYLLLLCPYRGLTDNVRCVRHLAICAGCHPTRGGEPLAHCIVL
jgi:hypothetical protein